MESTPITREDGVRLLKSGKFDEAIEILNKVIKAEGEDAQLHTYLGAAYSQKGDRLHAIAAFEQSLRLEETPKGYYNLGHIYEQVNRIDEAIRQYRMAVELDPDYAPAQDALSRLHTKFAADHPELQAAAAPAGAQAGGRQPQPTQAMPAQPGAPGTGGPPPKVYERQMKQQMAVIEQQQAVMRAGLSYGVGGGALSTPLIYAMAFLVKIMLPWLPVPLPEFATRGAGFFLFILILAGIGAVLGMGIGAWIGHTCGGDMAGLQAGAVLGIPLSVIVAISAKAAGAQIMTVTLFYIMCVGGMGYMIGMIFDKSFGWN